MSQTTKLLGVFTLLFGFTAGCQLPYEPIWLPDSSGFIYTKDDGSVIQYDIKKKSSRSLCEPGNYQARRVAISPKGDQVAFAAAAWGPKCSAVAINVIQLSDGALIDARLEKIGDPMGDREARPASCYWCPSGKRLLICVASGQYSESVQPVIYDLQAKQFRHLKAPPPAVFLCSLMGVTPLRPDGKGYLAMMYEEKSLQLDFVDWEGWRHKIELTAELSELLRRTGEKDAFKAKETPTIPTGRWDGSVLSFPFREGKVRIDTEKRIATLDTSEVAKESGQDHQITNDSLNSMIFADSGLQINFRNSGDAYQLELTDPTKNRRRVLLESVEWNLGRPLILSPDGKFVIVQAKVNDRLSILVLASDGTTVAELDVGKP